MSMQINESPECRVWIIFPDGRPPTPIKEDGINKMSIDKPEETE
jgi:hypothetical protein